MTTTTLPPLTRSGYDDLDRLMGLMTGDEKHSGASTSTLDVLWVLYDRVLRVRPAPDRGEDRDRFLLSKGHGPMAYYAVLAAKGFFPEEWLPGWATFESPLGHHPDRNLVPGVEISSGSLGHGLPLGVGTELGLRAQGIDARTVVLVGVPNPEMTLELPFIDVFGRGGALKSSWYGDCLPSRDFPMLIDLYLQGRLDLDGFVSETIGLDGVEEAFHKMERGEVLRSVVVF